MLTGERLGVVTRYPEHAAEFALSFWESKDVGGAWSDAPPGTVPMISAFGDNRLAREHPEWVQVGPEGERGDRSTRYFDWSTLCPTRPEVFDLAVDWARRAWNAQGLRLDDVTYAREGYCRCDACRREIERSGLGPQGYRVDRISQFVRQVRGQSACPLYFTLYPDPYPGHLARRFGVDTSLLAEMVDVFVVPIYDLAYSTTYWLETLLLGFRDLLSRPLFVELYGLDVPEDRLLKAAQVAQTYADCVLIAYERDIGKLRRVRDALST